MLRVAIALRVKWGLIIHWRERHHKWTVWIVPMGFIVLWVLLLQEVVLKDTFAIQLKILVSQGSVQAALIKT